VEGAATEPVRTRRHGRALEAALLDAAWDELVESGFANLTMESVAARAKTGVAVLYRRWANKNELVLAAVRHCTATSPIDAPDTGSLRGDMIAILTRISQARSNFFAIAAAVANSGMLVAAGETPASLRQQILGGQIEHTWRTLYIRADRRGELDLERVPKAVLTMPFDLVRHDMLMNLKPVSPVRIVSIVDEVFLPLVEAYGAIPGSHRVGKPDVRMHRHAHRHGGGRWTWHSLV
jgi:AcrR family transcriptional regulator